MGPWFQEFERSGRLAGYSGKIYLQGVLKVQPMFLKLVDKSMQ